ncbi:hypothetical protein ILYODFUR_036883 [Ilyodon furcidens]|uniref:Uncharacterized protein n=1 Tax=Ilyodon furcidens TaxID=33524 RepID=A0ABV0UD79_9TELE
MTFNPLDYLHVGVGGGLSICVEVHGVFVEWVYVREFVTRRCIVFKLARMVEGLQHTGRKSIKGQVDSPPEGLSSPKQTYKGYHPSHTSTSCHAGQAQDTASSVPQGTHQLTACYGHLHAKS